MGLSIPGGSSSVTWAHYLLNPNLDPHGSWTLFQGPDTCPKPNPLLSRGRISFLFVCNLLLFVKKATNPNQIWLMNLISLLLMLVHLSLILCNVRLSVKVDLS